MPEKITIKINAMDKNNLLNAKRLKWNPYFN